MTTRSRHRNIHIPEGELHVSTLLGSKRCGLSPPRNLFQTLPPARDLSQTCSHSRPLTNTATSEPTDTATIVSTRLSSSYEGLHLPIARVARRRSFSGDDTTATDLTVPLRTLLSASTCSSRSCPIQMLPHLSSHRWPLVAPAISSLASFGYLSPLAPEEA